MKLTLFDILIILAYLASTIVIGLVMKKRAQKDKTAYMLGGNKLPWYMLGLSNASGMFDISGTMWLVTLAFVYGLKSIWIPWLWPVFNQIFLMVFLSIWLRRSNATTGAEWIRTRFGSGPDGVQSHWIVVAFALISCLGFLTYGFIGLGKIRGNLHPLGDCLPLLSPLRYLRSMWPMCTGSSSPFSPCSMPSWEG
jgi:SSS family solute:Na+ symporter